MPKSAARYKKLTLSIRSDELPVFARTSATKIKAKKPTPAVYAARTAGLKSCAESSATRRPQRLQKIRLGWIEVPQPEQYIFIN